MPDVVELARALVNAIDKHELGEPVALPRELTGSVDALRIELERIEALRAAPPAPGSLDAQLLAELERVRRG
jgi:hypothetical protein